jgi:hypothetical protein
VSLSALYEPYSISLIAVVDKSALLCKNIMDTGV